VLILFYFWIHPSLLLICCITTLSTQSILGKKVTEAIGNVELHKFAKENSITFLGTQQHPSAPKTQGRKYIPYMLQLRDVITNIEYGKPVEALEELTPPKDDDEEEVEPVPAPKKRTGKAPSTPEKKRAAKQQACRSKKRSKKLKTC